MTIFYYLPDFLKSCDLFQFWTGIFTLRIFEILWHFTPETLITCDTKDTDFLKSCDTWDTDYITDNWEQHY